MRHRLAFQRILARLSTVPGWVLTGGFSLEARLGLDARATKDLDLRRRQANNSSWSDMQEALEDVLDQDIGDGFTFQVGRPRRLGLADTEQATWRVQVRVAYYGSPFADVQVDIAETAAPDSGDTTTLEIEPALIGNPFTIATIDLNRHAAEKFHACLRIYAHDRPSSRVKDLVDLVLLIEGDWLKADLLRAALTRVFAERNGSEPPPEMPSQPPADWAVTYPALATEVSIANDTLEQGWALASAYYQNAIRPQEHK